MIITKQGTQRENTQEETRHVKKKSLNMAGAETIYLVKCGSGSEQGDLQNGLFESHLITINIHTWN